jgi:hypothetical protein
MPTVRLSRVLLLLSFAMGVVSVVAALLSAWQAALQCGLVTLAALIGYVMVAGRVAASRVRWALAAGVGFLAVVMAVRLFWYREPAGDFRWIEPFYAALDGSGARVGPVQGLPSALLDQWRRMIDRERIAAVGQLFGVLCLAVGVLALPARRRWKRAELTTVLALLLLAVAGVNVWSLVDDAPMLQLLGTAWPALLATLVAVGLLVLSGWRADRAWLLPAGTFLVAVTAVTAFDDLAGTWSAWWALSNQLINLGEVDRSAAIGVSMDGPLEVSAAVQVAVALAGPALLTVGALHASRDVGPAEPWSDAG